MPFSIIRDDITKLRVDAIVNAANRHLQMGGGVCGAIFSAAGAGQLQDACDGLAPVETGGVAITPGFGLPAKHVIHAVGPVYRGGSHGEEALLRSCYVNSLTLALQHDCESIAFPLISSGIYGYPKDEALAVATDSISRWLADNDMDVFLVVFDKAAFKISQGLHGDVQSFIDENYVEAREKQHRRPTIARGDTLPYGVSMQETSFTADFPAERAVVMESMRMPSAAAPVKFDGGIGNLDEPFSSTLLRLIDAKGRSDVEVYKRANIDRKLFSKIRAGKGYMPSKKTAVALAVALELSLAETRDLLERAGFALSRAVMFDVIIEYFITHSKYDIFEINNVLFEYDQPLLGG